MQGFWILLTNATVCDHDQSSDTYTGNHCRGSNLYEHQKNKVRFPFQNLKQDFSILSKSFYFTIGYLTTKVM